MYSFYTLYNLAIFIALTNSLSVRGGYNSGIKDKELTMNPQVLPLTKIRTLTDSILSITKTKHTQFTTFLLFLRFYAGKDSLFLYMQFISLIEDYVPSKILVALIASLCIIFWEATILGITIYFYFTSK